MNIHRKKDDKNAYVALAREALTEKVTTGRIIDERTLDLPDRMRTQRAGVFVSIKTKHGKLRGCIGTILSTKENIAKEIIHNAIQAGTQDPRFPPVQPMELSDLVFSVDILKSPEAVDSNDQLDVIKYGVIVKKGRRKGLLLPNLDGVESVSKQIDIALSKAGIDPDEDYMLERFEVIRYFEEDDGD